MKANELRIGNYVTYDNEHNIPVKIKGLNSDAVDTGYRKFLFYDKIFPIPLTEEWLLKFGFFRHSNWQFHKAPFKICLEEGKYRGYVFSQSWNKGLNGKIHTEDKDFWDFKDYDAECVTLFGFKYVHQLQNLYFALTGEELTIDP